MKRNCFLIRRATALLLVAFMLFAVVACDKEATLPTPPSDATPSQPSEPDNPSQPDEPNEPDEPSQPDDPNEPDEPSQPDDPTPPPVDTKVDLSKINITVPLYGTSLSKVEDGKFDVSLGKGESFGLEVQGTDVKPVWSVANSSIATVSSDGTIKGITSGETTITAKLGDVSVEIIVRVK